MSISLVLLVGMAAMYSCGIYLLLERSMTRVLLGFLLVGNATNLLILMMSGRAGLAPIFGTVAEEDMADPLPQALILTAIVISFGISAFVLALIYRSWRIARIDAVTDDTDDQAIGSRAQLEEAEDDVDTQADTEFGTLAEAAVSSARDLEESDEAAAIGAADDSSARTDPRDRS